MSGSLKATLTCQICKCIFEKPVKLKCKATVCKSHLYDSNGQLISHFDCLFCNSTHETSLTDFFYPNFNVQNQINAHNYLNSNELEVKYQIEATIKGLEEVYIKYDQAGESVDIYFKQMQYDINLRRYQLKSQIDNLTEKLLDLIEKFKLKYKSELSKNNSKTIQVEELDFFRKRLNLNLRQSQIEIDKLLKLQDEIKNRQLNLNCDLILIEEEMKMYEFKANENFNFDEFDILGNFVRKNDILDELKPDFKIITCYSDGSIKIKDLNQTFETSFEKTSDKNVNCLQISLDNKNLLSGEKDNCLNVYSIDSGKLLKTIKPSLYRSQIICLQTTFNNNEILAGSSDSFIYHWDWISGELLKTFQGHTKPVTCLQMLGPNCFISGSSDLTIKIWNLLTKRCIQVLEGHTNSVSCLKRLNNFDFSSGSKDGTIRIWKINQLNTEYECFKVLFGYSGWINDLALASSNYLISGSLKMQFYDINNDFHCIKSINTQNGAIRRLQVLPNNKVLVSINKTNLFEVWCLNNFKCLQVINDHNSLNAIQLYHKK